MSNKATMEVKVSTLCISPPHHILLLELNYPISVWPRLGTKQRQHPHFLDDFSHRFNFSRYICRECVKLYRCSIYLYVSVIQADKISQLSNTRAGAFLRSVLINITTFRWDPCAIADTMEFRFRSLSKIIQGLQTFSCPSPRYHDLFVE